MGRQKGDSMIIDVHGHITPPEQFKRFPMPPSLGDVEGMIEKKAEAGIDLTIVGSPVGAGAMMRVPGIDNYAQTADQLRAFHDWLAETCARHQGRLKAYVYTNPLGDDRLLEAAADTLAGDDFVGFIVNTSVQGRYLDSEGADSFFAMVADLDVPVLLHPPAEPVGSDGFADFRLVEQVSRFNDVTAGLAAFLFAGWLERYPGLKVIGATAGGAISLLTAKMDLAHKPAHWGPPPGGGPGGAPGPPGGDPAPSRPKMMAFESRITRPPSEHLRSVFLDTASPSADALAANMGVVGAGHMLFATDAPPLSSPLHHSIDLVRGLPLGEEDKERILGGNAQDLFRLGATA